jgi:EpsI family protein
MQTKDHLQPAQLAIQQISLQHVWISIFMLCCFLVTLFITPRTTWFEHIGSPQMSEIIPHQFGDWVEVTEGLGSTVIDPEQQYAINNLYTQTVSRVYEQRKSGRRIMLSVAYGDNQSFSKQLHRPEACYSSQGFKIEKVYEEQVQTLGRPITVNRMLATIGSRLEQVSYWIRIGDGLISGPPTALNIARLKMSIKGYITDGLLFRISEVTENEQEAHKLQDQFIQDFLQALSPAQRGVMIGETHKAF